MLVEFSIAEGKTEQLRVYTRGGRAAVIELSWSRLLEGMLQEREQSQKSEETYFTLLILSIVLNEGHSRPRAHLCIFSVCAGSVLWTASSSYRNWETGIIYVVVFAFMYGKGVWELQLKFTISAAFCSYLVGSMRGLPPP